MTSNKKNPIISLCSSVKFALTLFIILAATSIIGTVIPQGKPIEFYVQQYGPETARFMQILKIPDMYSSWWFLGILSLFCINLIVCSLERIPNVWKIIKRDNLETQIERLKKMGNKKEFTLSGNPENSERIVADFLSKKGWKTEKREKDGGALLFSQKGGWTRFGVYFVHTSILIIFVGAIIGSPEIARNILHSPNFAFKGSVMLPETSQTDIIYSFNNSERIDLGFTVSCDFFNIEYYDNGMPKEYVSTLTVREGGREVLKKDIEVNHPLVYKGITFYQSSYQPYNEFIISIKKEKGANQKIVIPSGKQINWIEGNVSYGIINAEKMGEAVHKIKIWFSDHQEQPLTFWVEPGREAVIERPSGKYILTAKQLYATGLQVAKDPGVWFVYGGCTFMLFGLIVAFFMSHKKIWVFVKEEQGEVKVLFSGSSNKNKVGFEKIFLGLTEDFNESQNL